MTTAEATAITTTFIIIVNKIVIVLEKYPKNQGMGQSSEIRYAC